MENLHPKAIWLFFFNTRRLGLPLFFLFTYFIAGIIAFSVRNFMGQISNQQGVTDIYLFFPFWAWSVLLISIALCISLNYIWAKLTYKYWLYEITEDIFKMEHGIIWKRYISIPYKRIQNVDIYRGVMARILGLSDLRIQTAGFGGVQGKWGASVEGNLPGIEREKAELLRKKIIKKSKIADL